MSDSPYEAPRFHAEFQRLERRSVLLMRREEWERMKGKQGEQVSIDIEKTPLARVAIEAEVTLTVYREHAADAARGTPINVDRYMVWERIPNHLNFTQMVNTASTEDNANMRGFLDDHVFMVKQPPDSDHWLTEVPARVRAVVVRKRKDR